MDKKKKRGKNRRLTQMIGEFNENVGKSTKGEE